MVFTKYFLSNLGRLLLMGKSKKGQLTLSEVDQLRDRKDREYQIELDSNVNLTAEEPDATGKAAHWAKDDLVQVQGTLARLPRVQDPDSVAQLHRVRSGGPFVGANYDHATNSINVSDLARGSSKGFRHDGDERELVSKQFQQANGKTISTMELVVTHEIGHDVHTKNASAFAAFQKAAGWHRVKVDVLRADGVSEKGIAKLEERRTNPSGKISDFQGDTHMYNADPETKDLFWALPIGAIPTNEESAPSVSTDDSWSYAKVNAREHFAEMYAKAVHVPEKLHEDLIVRPDAAAIAAHEHSRKVRRRLDDAQALAVRGAYPELMLAYLRMNARVADTDVTYRESARDLRKAQFEVMRNDVFDTDRAVQVSIQRLQLMNVSSDKIQRFKERAAAASTPEQVAYLEAEVAQ